MAIRCDRYRIALIARDPLPRGAVKAPKSQLGAQITLVGAQQAVAIQTQRHAAFAVGPKG